MKFASLVFLILILFFLPVSCLAASKNVNDPLFQINNSLPQSELADYNDSFDEFNDEKWEKIIVLSKDQMTNFGNDIKATDIVPINGKLIMRTPRRQFSKTNLRSKFFLSGDFDIQVEMLIQFRKGDKIAANHALDFKN